MATFHPKTGKGPTYTQTTEPINPVESETWFNPSTNQMKIFNGTSWKLLWEDFGGLYGYNTGGTSGPTYLTTVERVAFPFDSGTATLVGNINTSSQSGAGFNSSIYGYQVIGTNATANITTIERLAFPDCVSSVQVGSLSITRYRSGTCNSSQHGYTMGGRNTASISTVDQLLFALDTTNCIASGTLSQVTDYNGGLNSSTHGYSLGGNPWTGTTYYSMVERLTFPFSGATLSSGINLALAKNATCSFNSSIHGYGAGGVLSGGAIVPSSIDRLTFPFSAGVTSYAGNLSKTKCASRGMNSSVYGYACGGSEGGITLVSSIERLQFPFDSGTASIVGNSLVTSRYNNNAIDDTDFLAQFV